MCDNVSVDFDLAPTKIGDVRIIARGGNPKANGFKCAKGGDNASIGNYQARRDLQFGLRFDF